MRFWANEILGNEARTSLNKSAYSQEPLQLICTNYTQSTDEAEGSGRNVDLLPRCIRQHVRLKESIAHMQ